MPSDAMRVWREAQAAYAEGADTAEAKLLRAIFGDEEASQKAAAVIERAIAEAVAEREALIVARYTWAANELLACDYGDNPRGVVGWRVYGWRTPNGSRRIYGASIDEAIDSAIERGDHKER